MKKPISQKNCRKNSLQRSKLAGFALAAILAVFPVAEGFGATYNVGPGKNKANLEDLRSSVILSGGDEIVLHANDVSLLSRFQINTYTSTNAVSIRSEGTNVVKFGGITGENSIFLELVKGSVQIGENLHFSSFNTTEDGGAVRLGQGTSLTLTGTTFTKNNSKGKGGVFLVDRATLSDNGSTFSENHSLFGGGVIDTTGGNITLTNSKFDTNTAASGGAISLVSGALETKNVRFEGNAAVGYDDALEPENNISGNGGAVNLSVSSILLKNTDFIGNEAVGLGGAIYVQGISSITLQTDELNHSRWQNNKDCYVDADNYEANSIHFNLDSADNIGVTQRLLVTGAGTLTMSDPLRATKTTGANSFLLIDKEGTGTWQLHGQTDLLNPFGNNLTTYLQVKEGTFELGNKATIEIGQGTFTLKSGATLASNGANVIRIANVAGTGKAVTLENGSRLEFNMSGMAGSDKNLTTMLTLDGSVSLPKQSVGQIVVDVTSVFAFDGNGDYTILTLEHGDLSLTNAGFVDGTNSNVKLLINGKPVENDSNNHRVGQRTFRLADNDNDGYNETIILSLIGVDENREIAWSGTEQSNVWSEEFANWNIGGADYNYFLNGDDVVFENGFGQVVVDAAGVAVGTMSVAGKFSFTGGDIHAEKLVYDKNGSAAFSTRTWNAPIVVADTVSAGLAAVSQGDDEAILTVSRSELGSAVTAGAGSVFYLGSTANTGTVHFKDNQSDTGGAAVNGDSVELRGGTNRFSNNISDTNGGAIQAKQFQILGGSAVFENNITQNLGGAVYVDGNATLTAKNGDILFNGNVHGATQSPNAVYLAQAGAKLMLNAYENHEIRFDDPIESAGKINVEINRNIAGAGTVMFNKYRSNIQGTTTVYAGTFGLGDGAVYGAPNGLETFNVESGATVLAEGNGNVIQADTITFETDTAIKVDLSNSVANDSAALTLSADTVVLPDVEMGGTITVDAVGPVKNGSFVLVSVDADNVENGFSTNNTVTLIDGKVWQDSPNDRIGDRKFIVESDTVTLVQSGFDQNRSMTWTGAADNVWSDATANWRTNDGSTTSKYFLDGDRVTFSDDSTNRTIKVGNSGVRVDSMTIIAGNYTFDGGSISKIVDTDQGTTHNLLKYGDGTLTLNQQNTFDLVDIQSGTLAGGKTKGYTIIGDLRMAQGTKLSPGGSEIGTFRVDGDIALNAGSYVYLDLGKTAAESDLLHATGSIDFGADAAGTVTVVVANNGLGENQRSTSSAVIQADDGLLLNGKALTDREAEANDDKIVIRQGNAKIEIRSDESLELKSASIFDDGKSLSIAATGQGTVMPQPAFSRNQFKALASIADADVNTYANRFMAQFSLTDDGDRAEFLERLLPSLNTAMPMVAYQAAMQYRQVSFERLRNLTDMASAHSVFAHNQGSSGQESSDVMLGQRFCIHKAPILWAQNYGNFLHQGGRKNVQGYQSNAYGISLGSDFWLDRNTVVGFGFGGAFADVKSSKRDQWGEANSFLFSLYGSRTTRNDVRLLGSVGYAYHDFEINRTPGGVPISSKHDGNMAFASLDVSKKFRASWTDFSPFATFDLVYLDEDGYDENTEAGATVSTVDGRIRYTLMQTLGVRFGRTRTNALGWKVDPSGWLGWVHDYGGRNFYVNSQYAGGLPFKIKGASTNRDRLGMGLNYNAAVTRSFSFFGGYNAEFCTHFSIHTIHAGLTYEF